MNNPMIYMLQAMKETDDTLHISLNNHAMSTVNFAVTLMQLLGGSTAPDGTPIAGWREKLQQQSNKVIKETLTPGPEHAAQAKVEQALYEKMNTQSDQQTSNWQSVIQSARAQFDQGNMANESNFSLVESTFSMQHYTTNLIKNRM